MPSTTGPRNKILRERQSQRDDDDNNNDDDNDNQAKSSNISIKYRKYALPSISERDSIVSSEMTYRGDEDG